MVILLRAIVVNKDRGQKVNKSTIKVLHVTSEANRSKFKMKHFYYIVNELAMS